MVVGDERLSAVERLDVYATMYFVRIHDVLRDEYARTAAVLGGEAFHALVTDYLRRLSARASVAARSGGAAAGVPGGARRWRPIDRGWWSWRGWSGRASRSSTDRTRRRCRSRRCATVAARTHSARYACDLIPAHRLLDGRFTISDTWRAEDPDAAPPRAEPETLIVWRRDVDVFHRPADADEAGWLPRLADGEGVSFESLCATLGETRADEVAGRARVRAVARAGRAEGLLARAAY